MTIYDDIAKSADKQAKRLEALEDFYSEVRKEARENKRRADKSLEYGITKRT